ncbi:sushi, von Willebrand factor type A, EGF and pentraxin domain-containing protein 1-like [Periplaneta americana]|uniref:sushi, von Willebrand factor type A, EGF and pentraxin domain-containing protein 1-like n=1 Tax=Periplaneta americana TaxID=6978 RepID=UPI0037E73398
MERVLKLLATLFILINFGEPTWAQRRLVGLINEVKPAQNLYKVALTQRGYIQFLRYQVEMPALHDFTLCIWMKSNNFSNPHPLFSYSKDEKDRLVRSWLEPPRHGRRAQVKLEVLEQELMSVPMDIAHGRWYHFCQSWSNAAGQWALHVDGKLKAAGDDWRLKGIIIPGGGDVVVGQEYTDFDKGLDDGIEGEIYGFNLLTSQRPHNLLGSPGLVRIKTSENALNLPSNYGKTPNWLSLTPFRGFRQTLRALTGEDRFQRKAIRWPEEPRATRSTPKSSSKKPGNSPGTSSVRWPEDHARGRGRRSVTRRSHQDSPEIKEKRAAKVDGDPLIRGERSYLQSWGFGIEGSDTNFAALNPGLELVLKSYNQCTVGRGSPVDKRRLLISWASTPVRVFGGAVIKGAKPVCGDF